MKVRNPSFVPPAVTWGVSKRAAVQAFITAQGGEFVDFEAIRAALPVGDRPAATDGAIAQIVSDLGYRIEQ